MNQLELKKEIMNTIDNQHSSILVIKGTNNSGKTYLSHELLKETKQNIIYHSGTHPQFRDAEMKYLAYVLNHIKLFNIIILDECFSKEFLEGFQVKGGTKLIIFTNDKYLEVDSHRFDVTKEFFLDRLTEIDKFTSEAKSPTCKNTRILGRCNNLSFEVRKSFQDEYQMELILDTSSKDDNLENRDIIKNIFEEADGIFFATQNGAFL